MDVQMIANRVNAISTESTLLGSDYGDVNYDKFLDILSRVNDLIDNIDKTTFNNSDEISQVISLLKDVLKPTMEVLRSFAIGRKNYLSAEYDERVLTGKFDEFTAKIDEQVNGLSNNLLQQEAQQVEKSMEESSVDTMSNNIEMPTSNMTQDIQTPTPDVPLEEESYSDENTQEESNEMTQYTGRQRVMVPFPNQKAA